MPDLQRLEWARRIVEEMGDRLPKDRREVYAREQLILHERQQTEIVVQGVRIGDIAIATTPTETYAITGLKIKADGQVFAAAFSRQRSSPEAAAAVSTLAPLSALATVVPACVCVVT